MIEPEPLTLFAGLTVDVRPDLLSEALTHRSYAYEHGGIPTSERLEFLGDSVLGVIVTERLYLTYPDASEGELSRYRAAVVSTRALAALARAHELGPHLKLGRGEERTGGHDKDSLLADMVEAIIGAVFLTVGMERTKAFVLDLVGPSIERAHSDDYLSDPKTSLQELAAELGLNGPTYEIASTGPDHDRTFIATAVLSGTRYASGEGRSKKRAEMVAAEATWRQLRAQPPQDA